MSILAHLNKHLKTLLKLLAIPKIYGPLATVLFTVVYHFGSLYFGYTVAPIVLVVFLATGSFVGGLRAGLICALWISAYSFFAVSDLSRNIQTSLCSFAVAFIIGWQTRELRKFYKTADELLEGNAEKLQQGLDFLRQAKNQLAEIRQKIELTEDRLGNVLSGVVGYKALKEMIREVDEWHKNPANLEKLQRLDKTKTLNKGD